MRSLFISLFLLCPVLLLADTTVTIRWVTTDSHKDAKAQKAAVEDAIEYRHGNMRRKDDVSANGMNVPISQIANCQSRTGFILDLSARQYRSYKVVSFAAPEQIKQYLSKNSQNVVQVESHTVDTGERRVIFGYTAKHLITTTKVPASRTNKGGEEVMDGWFADHEGLDTECMPDYARSEPIYAIGTGLVSYPQVPEFHHSGPLPSGLPLKVTLRITQFGADNGANRTITVEKTVEKISDAPIKPALFELPKGLRENPRLLRGSSVSTR
ncbi:MAG TPA: hypothetical protein VLW06_11065 [Terriglobales bacterium]|nr:hypothetical protein [Terriglobales bacterium]